MLHTSIKMNTPCELINITPLNPLISKCQIKVCYVGDEPNRNKSIITKDVAKQIANSLPGSPIVGYYNETSGDFEEHNRIIDISNGKLKLKDNTKPYGFVDLNAKVWFQKFLDDGEFEREYMVTEGYLWTGQYPEAQRIIDQGNNQSMELDEEIIDAHWSKDPNGKRQFFIINEAIISKLCILGENVEPCFEGANITGDTDNEPTLHFSLEDNFKEQLFSMIKEIKDMIEGGAPMFNRYAVEIGDSLWCMIWDYLDVAYPRVEDDGHICGSVYSIEGIYEEESQKFVIIKHRSNSKLFRLDFELSETEGLITSGGLVEVTKTYVPAETPQFAAEDVAAFEQSHYAKKEEEEKEEDNKEEEEEEICPECGKPVSECECEEEKEEEEEDKKAKYNLDEIQEYVELQENYSALETKYNELTAEHEAVKAEMASLVEFKKSIDKKEKEAMIESFYMLNEEDKEDVRANIDTYSLSDIEAKLSIICVRNKVSFEDAPVDNKVDNPVVFNLNDDFDSTPAWIKSLQSVAKDMQ